MIHVLLAEDDELIRESLAALLGREDDIRIVAAAPDGHLAVEAALLYRPDVVVADLAMPRLDGLGVVRELGRTLPGCAVVILTAHGSPLAIRRALASGARGFLAKGAPGTALADEERRDHEEKYGEGELALVRPHEGPEPSEALRVVGLERALLVEAREGLLGALALGLHDRARGGCLRLLSDHGLASSSRASRSASRACSLANAA